jgi:hypothetical protein
MTPTQYRQACKKLDLSIYASAKVLCINLRTAQRYAAGESPIPEQTAKLLRALMELGRTDV